MKGTAQFPMCGFSGRAVQILKACGVDDLTTVNVLEDEEIRQGIKDYANWPTIPQLYVNGEFVGGSDIMMEMYQAGELQQVLGKGLSPCAWSSASPAPPARSTACACWSAPVRWALQTHLVATPAGVLNAHHELGLDRSALEALAHESHNPGRHRRLHRQRQLRAAGDGRRAVLDEVAGRDRPRLRRQPADARRRRDAEGAAARWC